MQTKNIGVDSFTKMMKNLTGTILVVDDEAKNRKIVKDLLEVNGYRVLEATNGKEALALVSEKNLDVILLDIMMPGIDGFEVCRRLKSNPETAHIPVIMITALTDRDDRIRGIKEGANDFISKPIDTKDVVLRVRNAVYSKHLYDEVKKAYDRLKELESLRDSLVHMIVHDMRQPITALSGYLQLLRMHDDSFKDETDKEMVDEAYGIAKILIEMISSLLDVNKLEEGKMILNKAEYDLFELAEEAVESVGVLKGNRTIHVTPADKRVTCRVDKNLISRVFSNLLGNAIKFTSDTGIIKISIVEEGNFIRVTVKDNGPGIPKEYHEKIFDKFGQIETRKEGRKYSTGLGLTFCRLAVEAHGGNIGVESEPGKGSSFWFTLPGEQ